MVCYCCNQLTEVEVGWGWQSWLCAVGDIFGEWEEKEGKKMKSKFIWHEKEIWRSWLK